VQGVPLDDQQQTNWCWAASTQMVVQYFGNPISQCQVVNTVKGLTNCCGYANMSMVPETGDAGNCIGCDCGGGGVYAPFGRSAKNSSSPLSWEQLQNALACTNTPVVFAWAWCGGGGHVMVVTGYDSTSGTDNVWVDNPEDPDPELMTYDEWANNAPCSSGAFNHTFDAEDYDFQ
jgi:hypothetical protein